MEHELTSSNIQQALPGTSYLPGSTLRNPHGSPRPLKTVKGDNGNRSGNSWQPLGRRRSYDNNHFYQPHPSHNSIVGVTDRVDLQGLSLRLLLRRLRKDGESKTADRLVYLTSSENADDGGDIPEISSVNSFVNFYLQNKDLGKPLLGVTHNAELQAIWELPDKCRLVMEFQEDEIVRYVYRRTGNLNISNFFTLGRQPCRKIRGILEHVLV